MEKICHKKCLTVIVFSIFCSCFSYAVDMDHANVLKVDGDVLYQKAGTSDWKKIELGTSLSEGDAIKTAENSEAVLNLAGFSKTAEIVVRPSSEFVFHTFRHDKSTAMDTTLLDVTMGAVLVKAEKLVGESKFEVKTPTSIVGIRGTTFEVTVS